MTGKEQLRTNAPEVLLVELSATEISLNVDPG